MDALCQKMMKVDHLFVYQNIIKNYRICVFQSDTQGRVFLHIIILLFISMSPFSTSLDYI